jgi:3-oxoacyl-[acyl-carrier protein] reductase
MTVPATANRLDGRTAVVTGGGSGIGLASARRFAREGAAVAVWDREPERVRSAVRSIEDAGGVAAGEVVDISDAVSVREAAAATVAELGPVTVLMNNAGVLDDYAPILDTDEELWDRIVGVNLKGPFLVTRALLPAMIEAGGGAIVNTASIAGLVAGGGGTAYTSAKHGVVGLTKQLAFDYGKQGIRVNAILPGAIETGMTRQIFADADAVVMAAVRGVPAGRHGQPEEIAALAAFLVSDEASFTHGACYVADGGWTVQ